MRSLALTVATGMLTSALWAYVVKPWLDREGEGAGNSGTVRDAYDELNDDSNPLRSV